MSSKTSEPRPELRKQILRSDGHGTEKFTLEGAQMVCGIRVADRIWSKLDDFDRHPPPSESSGVWISRARGAPTLFGRQQRKLRLRGREKLCAADRIG